MENPATWGPAEKVIHEVLRDKINILPEFKAGLSTERRIADALREAGLLEDERNPAHFQESCEDSRESSA